MRASVLMALLALGLAGCFKVGPDYQRPAFDTPEAWRLSLTEAHSDARWWRAFKDPVLERLMRQAMRENLDLRRAVAAVDEYLGLYQTSRSDLFPQLYATVSGQQQQVSGALGTSYDGLSRLSQSAQIGLNLYWQVDIWGQLRRATEAARADLLAREENRRAVVLLLTSQVAIGYIQLRERDQLLNITRAALADRQEALRIAIIRFNGQIVSRLILRQAESEVEAITAQVAALQEQIAQKENELSVLLGHSPRAIERGLPLAELHPPSIPAGLPAELMTRRPDLRQAEQSLIAATARIGVAKGDYFPKVFLTGSAGQTSAELANLMTGPAGIWSYGANLLTPIFTAGQIAGRVASAEAREQQALLAYRQSLLTAFKEVENALVDYRMTQAQVEAQTRQVAALHDYLRLARIRFDNGYTSYLEVLDSQRNLLNAQLVLASNQSNVLQAVVGLYAALGGGWIEQAEHWAIPTKH